MPNTAEVIATIKKLRKELADIREQLSRPSSHASWDQPDEGLLDEKLKRWALRTYEHLRAWGFSAEAEQGFGPHSVIRMYNGVHRRAKMMDDRLNALEDDMESHPEHYEQKFADSPNAAQSAQNTKPKPHKIFLGHGRNKVWARVHMFLKEDLGLNVEVWEGTSRTGLHAVEVLNEVLDGCTFAVVVVTGDDATADGELRARQNVVHEIGLFQGHLGFEKVALLQQRGIEGLSNLWGLQVILFSEDKIEETFYELRRMLERERILHLGK